jgi:hypothetical protein
MLQYKRTAVPETGLKEDRLVPLHLLCPPVPRPPTGLASRGSATWRRDGRSSNRNLGEFVSIGANSKIFICSGKLCAVILLADSHLES